MVSGEWSRTRACREHSIGSSLLARWLVQYEASGSEAFETSEFPVGLSADSRVRDLEAALGRAHLEIELLKSALSKKGSPDGSFDK